MKVDNLSISLHLGRVLEVHPDCSPLDAFGKLDFMV